MRKRSKKYIDKFKLVDRAKRYPLEEAVKIVKQLGTAKFDETVELSVKLGIDLKRSDQQVRGTVLLPGGTGKTKKVLVFARGEKVREAEQAGADHVGAEDLIEKIQKGWLDFDVVIATPDVMGQIGKLGKILGQKGMMPNPKTGTVTFDIKKTVEEFKKGKVEYKNDKTGVIHLALGKLSFDGGKIASNVTAVMEAVQKAKPSSIKGIYIRSVTLSPTMGPSVKIDTNSLLKEVEE